MQLQYVCVTWAVAEMTISVSDSKHPRQRDIDQLFGSLLKWLKDWLKALHLHYQYHLCSALSRLLWPRISKLLWPRILPCQAFIAAALHGWGGLPPTLPCLMRAMIAE